MSELSKKKRLDALMVEQGLAETRVRAQALILGGGVAVNGEVVTKPATGVAAGNSVTLVREPLPYVSRGGLKLQHALDTFRIDPTGRVALDVGASTGGFTDVLLKAGAAKVYAIDVGYGQLAWVLRNDPRVVVMERTNIRNVESLPDEVDLAVADVSFISLRLVLPVIRRLMSSRGQAVLLIKPQFEAGREKVGKKGVVRDPDVWRQVLDSVLRFAHAEGWAVLGLDRSPVLGPAGNVEFLAQLGLATSSKLELKQLIEAAIGGQTSP